MLTVYHWIAAVTLLALAILTAWLVFRPARRVVRYVPVGLMGRRYVVWRPVPRKQRQPIPVVFAFHAEGTTVEHFEIQAKLHMARAAARFVIVYPEGYHGSWNAGRCCGDAARSGIDEISFLNAMLDDLGAHVEIDRRRVFVTGYANGAMLCYFFACNISEQIAAIAPVDGGMAADNCSPKRAVPVFHFEGVARHLDWNADAVLPLEQRSTTADTIGFWCKTNGLCRAREVPMFGGLADCLIYSGDKRDVEVRMCAIRLEPDGLTSGAASAGGPDPESEGSRPAILRALVNDAILEFFADKALPEGQPHRIRLDLE